MRAGSILVGCLIAAIAGTAAAQAPASGDAPAATPPEPPAAPVPAPAAPAPADPTAPGAPADAPAPPPASPLPDRRDDAGWRLYHEAFTALIEGQRARAAELANQLRREHPAHPAAAIVAASPLAALGYGERIRRARREEPTSGASSELALFQTMHGLALGIELCVALDCNDEGAVIGLALAGAGGGALVSLKVLEEVTSGQRALLNGGTFWGAFNSLMLIIAIEPEGPDEEQDIALGMIGGQTLGLATGAVLLGSRPTAGQVALASSGGQWGALLMWLALTAARTDTDGRDVAVSLMIGADAGLAMGAYLAKLRPDVSRAQTLVIDAGGIVGGVAGGGLGVLISGSVGDRVTAAVAALGAAAGLGAAAYFTRNWGESDDGDPAGTRAVLMPSQDGRGGLLGFARAW